MHNFCHFKVMKVNEFCSTRTISGYLSVKQVKKKSKAEITNSNKGTLCENWPPVELTPQINRRPHMNRVTANCC